MADKRSVVYDLPPNYVSIAMLKEKWTKEQERKKKEEEERNRTKQTNLQESETPIQAEESVVPALEGTEKERVREIQETKKKKRSNKKKARERREKKGEDSDEDKVAGDDRCAAVISEKTNSPAGEITVKGEIVPKRIARGGEDAKQNHKEKEKGSGVRYAKKVVMPSNIAPKSGIVRERSYRGGKVAQRVGDLTVNNYGNSEIVRERSYRGEQVEQKVGDLTVNNYGKSEIVRETSCRGEQVAQRVGDLTLNNYGKSEIVRERSYRGEQVGQRVGDLTVNNYGKGGSTRTIGESKGSGGYWRRTNVRTAWVRKGEAAGSIGAVGAR